MASDVEIANAALLKIGQPPISSFDEDDQGAILANNTYEIHRDALLRACPWRFAMARTSLAACVETPDWEFAYYYQLPSEPYCIRVLTIENLADYDWRLEGRRIATDVGAPLYLKYICRVTNPEQFDPLFTETLVAKLAYEWSERLEQSTALSERLLRDYAAKFAEAESVNGSEGKLEPLPDGSWYEAHLA